MTMKITLECDAMSCFNEVEIDDTYESDISGAGWHVAPDDGYTHYCPSCWPEVKAEYEAEEEDDE